MNKYDIEKAIVYGHEKAIDLLKARKLKEIITADVSRDYTDEKIFICDDTKLYGVIILNKATQLDVDQFRNHQSRHFITDELREDVWGNTKVFNSHTFRIKKVFKNPIEYKSEKVSLSLGKFIDDVKVVNVEKEIFIKHQSILEDAKKKISVDGKENLKEMFENLYELFLEKYSEKVNKKSEKIYA